MYVLHHQWYCCLDLLCHVNKGHMRVGTPSMDMTECFWQLPWRMHATIVTYAVLGVCCT